jgi:hypothetical protein
MGYVGERIQSIEMHADKSKDRVYNMRIIGDKTVLYYGFLPKHGFYLPLSESEVMNMKICFAIVTILLCVCIS